MVEQQALGVLCEGRVKFTLCKIPQLLSTELSVVERVKNLMNAFENLHKT